MARPDVHLVRGALQLYRFTFGSERELQNGIEEAFRIEFGAGEFEREVRLSPADVVDFLVDGTAVEVKVDGGVGEILRQLARYAASPRVSGLLLVTRKAQHAHRFPRELGGKPLEVLTLEASAL